MGFEIFWDAIEYLFFHLCLVCFLVCFLVFDFFSTMGVPMTQKARRSKRFRRRTSTRPRSSLRRRVRKERGKGGVADGEGEGGRHRMGGNPTITIEGRVYKVKYIDNNKLIIDMHKDDSGYHDYVLVITGDGDNIQKQIENNWKLSTNKEFVKNPLIIREKETDRITIESDSFKRLKSVVGTIDVVGDTLKFRIREASYNRLVRDS